VIGVGRKQASRAVIRVKILSGDQDLFQLVDLKQSRCSCTWVCLRPAEQQFSSEFGPGKLGSGNWGFYRLWIIRRCVAMPLSNIPGVKVMRLNSRAVARAVWFPGTDPVFSPDRDLPKGSAKP